MKNTIFILILLTKIQFTYSQTKIFSNKDLALQFMKAYGDWDYDKMGTFYHDSIHFQDPTAMDAFKSKYDYTGKENVINFVKNVFKNEKPKYIAFHVNSSFVSNNYVIVNSNYESIIPASWFGDKLNGNILVSIPVVTVLKFKGTKIIEHIDYANYDKYNQQVTLQLKK